MLIALILSVVFIITFFICEHNYIDSSIPLIGLGLTTSYLFFGSIMWFAMIVTN